MAAVTSASWDVYRDLRDDGGAFFRTYGPASIGFAADDKEATAAEPIDPRNAPLVKKALSHIEDGDRTKAMVRAALLLMKAGTGRRRLSAMKRTRELVGRDIGLLDITAEAAREIIREQSYIVDFEPAKALAALRSSCGHRRTGVGSSICSTGLRARSRPMPSRSSTGRDRRVLSQTGSEGEAKRPANHGDAGGAPDRGPPRGGGQAGLSPARQ